MRKSYQRLLIRLAALFLLVVLTYFNSFNAGFTSDDKIGILQNQNIGIMSSVFEKPLLSLRPLELYLAHEIGEFQPIYYHSMNIAFHIGTVWLFYILLGLMGVGSIGFSIAVLYAVHPVLVESVAWVSAYSYTQYSFFLILALVFYVASKKKTKYSYYFLVLFFSSGCLAILSSEKAYILPLVIVLYEWAFGSIKKNWRIIIGSFSMLLITCSMLYSQLQVRIGSFTGIIAEGKGDLYLNPLMQMPYVLGTYIHLIFWPDRLTLYRLDEMGITTSMIAINTLLMIVYLTSTVVAYKKNKIVFFFLSFFFIASLPALIPLNITQTAAERYVYLGSFGLIAAIVLTLFKTVRKYKVNTVLSYALLLICLLALAWRTSVRVNDWQDEMTLRLATLRDAPYSARAHNNVGTELMTQGDLKGALEEYKQAIALNPDYSHPYSNIGQLLALARRYEESVLYYKKAQRLNPYEMKSYQDLGQVYFLLKDYKAAKYQLTKAIEYGSKDSNQLQTILKEIKRLGY